VSTITQYFSKLFTGSGPAKPDALGDIYYAQDLARDYAWVMDRIGSLAADVAGATAILISGGVVTDDGSHSHVNITAGVGYAPFTVTLGIDGNVPPTSGTEDITAVRIAWGAQTSVGTFAGTTTYYVKMAYAEANGLNRQRARAAGTYYFTKQPSFTMTIDTSAPTAYQVLLATISVSSGSIAAITQAQIAAGRIANTERYTPTTGYTPAIGDVVELNYDGTIRKAKRVNSTAYTPVTGTDVRGVRVAPLDATRFVMLYSMFSTNTVYAVVGTVSLNDLSVSWGTAVTVRAGTNPPSFDVAAIDSTRVLAATNTNGVGASQAQVAVLSVSGTTITVNSGVNGDASAYYVGLASIPGSTNVLLLTEHISPSTQVTASVVSISGTVPTINASASLTLGNIPSSPYSICCSVTPDGKSAFVGGVNSSTVWIVSIFGINGTTVTAGNQVTLTVLFAGSVMPSASADNSGFVAFLTTGTQNETNGNWPLTYVAFIKRIGTAMIALDTLESLVPFARFRWGSSSIYGVPSLHVADQGSGVYFTSGIVKNGADGTVNILTLFFRRQGLTENNAVQSGDAYQLATGLAFGTAGIDVQGGSCQLLNSGVAVAGRVSYQSNSIYVLAVRRRNAILGVAVDALGTVQRSGTLSGLSGLTVGPVGVDDNGNLSSVVGEAKIGQALSATVLDLQVVPGI